jgi:hypothetical protein
MALILLSAGLTDSAVAAQPIDTISVAGNRLIADGRAVGATRSECRRAFTTSTLAISEMRGGDGELGR